MKNPIVVAIIACVPMTTQHPQMTHNCVESFSKVVDKVILIQNGVTQYNLLPETLELVDIFVKNKVNRLHAGAINQGFKLLQDNEYGMVICDDVIAGSITKNDIQALAETGSILSPPIYSPRDSMILDVNYGAHSMVFVVGKQEFWLVGSWKLSEGHLADVDWFDRAKETNLRMDTLEVGEVIHTKPASTIGLITNPPKYNENEI